MCGLYGSIGFAPDKTRLDRIAHRGPDGEGWEEFSTKFGTMCFGHRRLSIIDLDSRANQPMHTQNEDFIIIQNGEIYNYKELRNELENLGQKFTTNSDTEVLLNSFKFWGVGSFTRLRGMFSCAIFDRAHDCLYLARDAFGIKPLYYVQTNEGIAFGSEIKQIYDFNGVSHRLNYARTWDFLVSMTTDHTEETMYEGVKQIRPGHFAKIDLDAAQLKMEISRWFEIPKINEKKISAEAAAIEFREKFLNSINLHLRADVAVGSCLSGGLDSSSVVGVACSILEKPEDFRTYSAVFPDTSVDESKFIKAVNQHNHCQPHLLEIEESRLEDVAKTLIYQQDEPFGSTSIFAQYFVFEAIGKDKTKVVLDGQGADEQLAGYHGIFDFYAQSLLRRGKIFSLAKLMIERKIYHNAPIFAPAWRLLKPRLARYIPSLRVPVSENYLTDSELNKFAPKSGSTMNEALLRDGLPKIDTIGELCLALTIGTNLPMLLRYEDRNSMAHSVEARVPFVETDLMAFTLGLGEHHKIVGGDTKRVLRDGVGDFLPKEVLYRRDKLGFSTPEKDWLHGPLKSFVKSGIELCFVRFPNLLNRAAVDRLAKAMDEKAPIDGVLWRIANLGHWAERFDIEP